MLNVWVSAGIDGFLRRHRMLLLDRDSLYTERAGEIFRNAGVKVIRLPRGSPNLNAFAERFVLSIKSECLRKIVPLGERHLRAAIRAYVEHYHLERNHQGLGNRLLRGATSGTPTAAPIQRRERLGGILSFYHRVAA